MILKPYEIQKHLDKNIFLFYGENSGQKEELIDQFFKLEYENEIYNYSEKEVFSNLDNFYNQINSRSFFEDKKLIIINSVSEKIKDEISDLISKNLQDIKIILIAGVLEKKSKLRSIFEKEKKLIIIPFYKDDIKSLSEIAKTFFKKRKILVSQETINIISQKSTGDRKNLKNELEKIENFLGVKKKLEIDDVLKLTNLAENYSINDLVNNCLAKNKKNTLRIINENIFSLEDCIIIIRTMLIASKRLLRLLKNKQKTSNLDQLLTSHKPPIFWKEKPIIKEQVQNWNEETVKELIYKINDTELIIKQNSNMSLNILLDFLIEQSQKFNN